MSELDMLRLDKAARFGMVSTTAFLLKRTGSLSVSRPVGQHSDERFEKLLSSHDRSDDTTPPRKTDHRKDIRS
jgi:hypothetical protein